MRLPYYTDADIAAMTDEGLDDLEFLLRSQIHGAFQVGSPAAAKLCGRAQFLLEVLVYPEIDRRRAARR